MSGYANIFDISASGMTLERARLEVSATNIANANTTRGPDGALFRPLRLLAHPAKGDLSFAAHMANVSGAAVSGVGRMELVPATVGPRMVYDPGHPDADERGFVQVPGVNPLLEMTQIMTAVRAYEANVRALNAARTMAVRALEIGEKR